MTEREAFEAWWDADNLSADNPFGLGSAAYWALEGWQACAALKDRRIAELELTLAVTKEDAEIHISRCYAAEAERDALREKVSGLESIVALSDDQMAHQGKQVAELTAERDTAKADRNTYDSAHKREAAAHLRTIAERDALQADALRYRWLRDVAPPDIGDMASVRDHIPVSDIDAAIDEAMK